MYFGVPDIRLDARCVSKTRLLSQTLANIVVEDRHISTSMQNCWSQCRTVKSYLPAWYQTENMSGSIGQLDILHGDLH
jgi:hypothetical protein